MSTNRKYLLTICLLVIVMLTSIGPTAKPAEDAGVPKKIKPILHAYDIILSKYLKSEEIDTQKLVKQAISGMLESLNSKYSKIYTQTEFKNYWETLTNGSYVGIGIEIEMLDGQPTILSLFPIPSNPGSTEPYLPGRQNKTHRQ